MPHLRGAIADAVCGGAKFGVGQLALQNAGASSRTPELNLWSLLMPFGCLLIGVCRV